MRAFLLLALSLSAQELVNEPDRIAEIRRLREADDSSRLGQVIATLARDESAAVRLEAVRTLNRGSFRGDRGFEAVAKAMNTDLSDTVRKAAAASVLSYEGGRPLSLVEAFLKDEQGEDVRRFVCVALATAPVHAGSSQVTTILTGRLAEDPSPVVRLAALESLASLGDRRALPDLKRAADKDDDKRVRERAKRVYAELSKPPKVEVRKPPKPPEVPYDAVKCPRGLGWCACEKGPIQPKPRCMDLEDCKQKYENVYRHQGFGCKWNGQSVDQL